MEQKKQEPIRDARQLGTAKMLILGLQHMFAMFGATILVPILVSGYFQKACGEPLTRGLSVSVTLFCAGFGTLIFHLCTKFKVPAFLGSSFAFLGGFILLQTLTVVCMQIWLSMIRPRMRVVEYLLQVCFISYLHLSLSWLELSV